MPTPLDTSLLRRPAPLLVLVALSALLVAGAASSALAQQPSPDSTPPPATGTAGITGVVTDTAGRPLAAVVVTTEAADRLVFTDSSGRFTLQRLPGVQTRFLVRRVGFAPAAFEINLQDSVTVSVAVKLWPSAQTLGTVVIEGERRDLGLMQEGFYKRKALGFGTFITPEELAASQPARISSLLGRVRGVRMHFIGGSDGIPMTTHVYRPCPFEIYLDGREFPLNRVGLADRMGIDAVMPAQWVKAIEVFPNALDVPGQYRKPYSKCGVILIWTGAVVE